MVAAGAMIAARIVAIGAASAAERGDAHILSVMPAPVDAAREAYQTAMERYVTELQAPAGSNGPTGLLIPYPQRFLWTWVGDSGRVQRVERSVFTVSGDDCLTRFCQMASCRLDVWPDFACTDGRSRRMAARHADEISFDGVSYRRLQPLP